MCYHDYTVIAILIFFFLGDQVVFCKPGELQLEVYRKVIQSPDVKLILNQSNPCQCGSSKKQVQCCVKVGIPMLSPDSHS